MIKSDRLLIPEKLDLPVCRKFASLHHKTLKMPLKAVRIVTTTVLLLILLEIVGAAITALPTSSEHTTTLHPKRSGTSVLASFLFEKSEEETEKTEKEKDRSDRVVLVDFSRVAFTLSFYHTSQKFLTHIAFLYNVRPPLHTLNCVFLI